jgi:hypothetical protein
MRWSICCISTARRSAQHRSLTERPVFSHGYGMVSQRTADAPAAAEMACFRAEDHAALPRPPLAIEPGGSIFGSQRRYNLSRNFWMTLAGWRLVPR